MKKFKPLAIVLAVTVFLTSCATLIRPTTTYTSNKPTADELKIGRKTYYNVAFPFSVKAKPGYGKTHVTAKRADSETVELDVHKTFYAMTFGNILLGGVFGLGIDLLTGGVAKPQYPTYHLNFMEKYNMYKGNMNYMAQNDLVQQQQIQQLQQIEQPKSTIYIYGGSLVNNQCHLIAVDDEYLTTIGGNSYIKVITTSDRINIKDYHVKEGISFETVKNGKCGILELLLNDEEYYIFLTSSAGIQQKPRTDFNNKVNKLSYKGEFKWNYEEAEPVMASTNVIQQQAQPAAAAATATTVPDVIESDVDVNIPKTERKASDTFVLIIANEHYTFVDNVDFAIHDGEIFKEYCIKTLGVPERQVWFYQDASAGIISGGVDKMVQAMSLFENSKAIVYYCGHGIPDEHTGDAYIVPTDGKGTNTATCYSLNKMYTTLAASNAVSVTYFMDACFSGANKEGSMLVAARGVAREPKKEILNGNTVVFSAASGDETAMTYKEKGHGLFTYFLLKKLQETNGDVSYGDLDKYIKDNVKRESFLTNEKVQHPATNVSENAVDTWKQMKLK